MFEEWKIDIRSGIHFQKIGIRLGMFLCLGGTSLTKFDQVPPLGLIRPTWTFTENFRLWSHLQKILDFGPSMEKAMPLFPLLHKYY